jgi:glycosyltransferase involved in cell wall biosynthesis
MGTVGRLVPQKNYHRALDGFSQVLSRLDREVRFLIIGSGPLERSLKSRAKALGIDSHVLFAGPLSREDVYAHLAAMDGFVMPSTFEGFCNAAVEAMATGLPVCASNIQTLREVLQDVPLYVDQADPSNIARGMLDLVNLTADELAARAAYARRLVETKYSIEAVSENYMERYRNILNGGPTSDNGQVQLANDS